MSALPSSSTEPITLRSISGKRTLLTPPVTLETVLKVATAPPFSFAPESVKIYIHGRLVHLLQYQKQHGADFSQIPLDASAYVSPRATIKGAHSVLSSSASSHAPDSKDEPRSVIVYGIPQRLRSARAVSSTSSEKQALRSPSPAAAGGHPISIPTFHRPESQTVLRGGHVTAARSLSYNAASQGRSSTGSTCHKTMDNLGMMRGPLPYPHSPGGLLELDEICAEIGLGEDDDFLALLQGAPQKIYNHPTMLYMSSRVMGDLAVLRTVMEQVASVSPVFFDWILKNPHKFLCALNRSGDHSLQQVKEQLRMLAIRAMAEQICGETPSRHVMMLELNTTDGSPDLYQVEVQVGDFSDASSSSDSPITTNLDVRGAVTEEEEGDDEVACLRMSEELEGDDTPSPMFKTSSEYGDDLEGAEEEEVVDEPHRGAILLPSTPGAQRRLSPSQPPTDAEPRATAPYDGCVLATSKGALSQDLGVSLTSSPRVGSVPVGVNNLSRPSSHRTLPAASSSALLDGSVSATLNAVSSPQEKHDDDGRLSNLEKELQHVDSLIQEWVDEPTTDTAWPAHSAITELRHRIFSLLKDFFTVFSSSASLSLQSFRDIRRLSLLAGHFFSKTEEFYVQLVEQGVRSTLFGEAPQNSVAAWAVVAALSRLLVCDVDAAVEQKLENQQKGLSHPPNVSVLRSVQEADPICANPAIRWAINEGPEKLLLALIHLCRQQRAVVLWYSSHHAMKAVGKTIQSIAYILGGTQEAQQTVALQRLKLTTKAHKQDEVADCMATLSDALAQTGTLTEAVRRQWFSLMRNRYQRLVMPLEKDLPTPHMTSYPLYVCDTRHILPPKGSAARCDSMRRGMHSAARWWPGYCDERHSFCADKWCLAITARLWNIVTAMENVAAGSVAESVAVVLSEEGAEARAVNSSSISSLRKCLEHMAYLPVDTVGTPSPAIAGLLLPRSVVRHSAILCEQVPAPSGSEEEKTEARHPSGVVESYGMIPLFCGDVHVVDVGAVDAGQMPVLSLGGGAALPTYVATVVRNFVLPALSSESIFLQHLFDVFSKHPNIPVAAAVRDAALANARAQNAPWLVSEYVVFDFGGTLSTFSEAHAKGAAAVASKNVAIRPTSFTAAEVLSPPKVVSSAEPTTECFVRMPSVPLSQRLTAPRPVPPTRRRSIQTNLRRPLGHSPLVSDEVVKRQYVRTHAIDEMYEMMLGSLLEHQPTGEAQVLDHLIQFVEASEDLMRGHSLQRQAEISTAAVAKVSPGVTPDNATVGVGSSHPKPHPPNGNRGSFPRRRH